MKKLLREMQTLRVCWL